MSSSQHFSVGAIGAGTLAQAIAGHAVGASHGYVAAGGPQFSGPIDLVGDTHPQPH